LCGKIITEAKSTRVPDGWGEPGTNQVPPDYLFQGIHYLNVYPEAERIDYPVLIGSSDFRIYQLQRNDEWQRKVLAHEVAFWQNHIVPRIPPDPFSQDDADKLYIDPIKGSRITMNDEIQSALFQIKTLREDKKVLEEREELIKQKIKEYMQNNENLLDCFGNLAATWKQQERTQFDKIGFVKSHDGLYNQFAKTVKTRVLLLK
jgi:predicted phage-related endonuclease